MTTQSLSQFAHEVGRSRDTVTRAIAALGLTVPKPPPGKPTQISRSVQDALRQHFRAYPQVQPEPQLPQDIDPRLMTALERIYKTNIQAHKSIQTQVAALEIHACVLKGEVADLTEMVSELRVEITDSRHLIHAPSVLKRPADWLRWRSPPLCSWLWRCGSFSSPPTHRQAGSAIQPTPNFTSRHHANLSPFHDRSGDPCWGFFGSRLVHQVY